MFDGRPVTTAASRRNNEDRFVSTAEMDSKIYTVVWMWRGEPWRGKGVSSDIRLRNWPPSASGGETRSDWARAAAMTDAEIEADIASDPDEAGMVLDWDSVSGELPKWSGERGHQH